MQELILDAITYVAARYLLNKNVERKNVIFKNCKHVHVASFMKWEGGGEQPRPKILDKPNKKQGGGGHVEIMKILILGGGSCIVLNILFSFDWIVDFLISLSLLFHLLSQESGGGNSMIIQFFYLCKFKNKCGGKPPPPPSTSLN